MSPGQKSAQVVSAAIFFVLAGADGSRHLLGQESSGTAPGAITESADDIATEIDDLTTKRLGIPGRPFAPIMDRLDDSMVWLDKKFGLSVGVAYTVVFQAATKGDYDGPREGGAGDVDLFGRWQLFNRDDHEGLINESTVGFALENRHRITENPPSELGDTIGSLWGTTRGFDDRGFVVKEWWWQQRFFDDRVNFRIGKVSLTNTFDVYRFSGSNHFFLNQAFSDNPTIPFPQNGFGVVVRWNPTEHWFAIAGTGDAQGRVTETDVSRAGDIGEWFTGLTVGRSGPVGNLGDGLYQVTYWHTDERSDSARPSSTGISLVAQQKFGDRFATFLRYSHADDIATDTQQLATGGIMWEQPFHRKNDRLGLGVAWGQPHQRNLRDQWSAELFYRWAALPEFRITPSAQLLINPSRNPDDNLIGIIGIRGRLTF